MNNEIEVLEWHEAVRRRPTMYIGGTDAWHLSWLVGELMDCPERPRKITLSLSNRVVEIDSVAVAPSMRPLRNGFPPFLVEACTRPNIGLDQPRTLAGYERLDTSSKPAIFRRGDCTSMALTL